jgi:hypothetical protein
MTEVAARAVRRTICADRFLQDGISYTSRAAFLCFAAVLGTGIYVSFAEIFL